jgi:hypothetical protein
MASSQSTAQEWRWLRIGELQCQFSDRGTEVEGEGYGNNTNFFSWPSQYGVVDQTTARQKTMWIGAKNFYDPIEGKEKSVKVVGIGPRENPERQNMIFEQSVKVIGKYPYPTVVVDDNIASDLAIYEQLDEFDENLPCDRMIIIKINTSIGVSVTKKIMAFSRPDHSNYFVNDITFKNTGIYNEAGDVHEQTLQDVWFYFAYRYAFAGESVAGFGSGWGSFSSTWGANTLNHAFGDDPTAAEFTNPGSPLYKLRAFYSWGGPNNESTLGFDDDWGCPNYAEDGVMASAKYAGCVTLHADKSVSDKSDDPYQPRTTWFVASDEGVWSADVSQYNEIYMQQRYNFMSEGHPPQSHADLIAENYKYVQEYQQVDSDRDVGGGASQGQGYGPYTMAPGDSVRIIFAEGVAGLSREKNREVGGNWYKYYSGTGNPPLVLPDGSTSSDHTEYKNEWVFTGEDSILQTYHKAVENFESGYTLPQPPPPPKEFIVQSGGDRIRLSWADNASSEPDFDGYQVYRSQGNVLTPLTVYTKVFECDKSSLVHGWDDTTAVRGFDYYYYVVSKDDGSENNGIPLKSGLFWTITNRPASLQRAAGSALEQVRVVPNPYDIRSRVFQFGDKSQYDRIAFYGLPPACHLRIFTERGDLIWEKDHTDGSGDELWDSLTSYGQIVVSGIYILHVEVTQDVLDESTGDQLFKAGESVMRKFVIIR